MEQVEGIEPSSSAWKAEVIAIIRHLHIYFLYFLKTFFIIMYVNSICQHFFEKILKKFIDGLNKIIIISLKNSNFR